MTNTIQSLEDSWKEHGADYLEDTKDTEDIAREKHLKDWVGDNSLAIWRHAAKELGVDFDFAEIEEALIEAEGNIKGALEVLRQEAEGDYFWISVQEEALTAAERNLSLIGAINA